MASGLRLIAALRGPARAWVGFTALLLLASLCAGWLPAAWLQALDWQPALALREPWRAWSAVFVHWSALHLGVNLVAAAVIAAFGVAARVPASAACAWIAAWPLTHLGLLLQPALTHYGGLSGVLHAGVAIVVCWLVVRERGARQAIGAAVLVGLVAKLISEQPFGPALRVADGWDIPVAPLAHFTGSVAGALCALLAIAWAGRRVRPRAAAPWRRSRP